ncbi:MAG: hypothetical protein ACLUEU_09570 [Oscillospiraceae bacterium]
MRNPFRKDIEPRCAYCAHGSAVNECEVACSRRGVVDGSDHCRHFRYDPLRRVPPRARLARSQSALAGGFFPLRVI